MESTGTVAEVGAGDPMLLAAAEEVKTLGGCCKDSDRVLEKINSEHEKLSKQGVTHPCIGRRQLWWYVQGWTIV